MSSRNFLISWCQGWILQQTRKRKRNPIGGWQESSTSQTGA